MEYLIVMAVPLALMGVLTGIYWSAEIYDRRIESLSASQYMSMHQMRDGTFAKVMPFVGFGTLLAVIVSVVLADRVRLATMAGCHRGRIDGDRHRLHRHPAIAIEPRGPELDGSNDPDTLAVRA